MLDNIFKYVIIAVVNDLSDRKCFSYRASFFYAYSASDSTKKTERGKK